MTQDRALEILKTGANVFLTGEPGSGKTHTINAYIHYLKSHDITPSVTASTGIAATHIGGMTIHSWSGIGIKRTLSEEDLDAMSMRESLMKRILSAKVLIIDEVSMLDGRLLAMVERTLCTLRRSEEVFGGIQVVLVGDFFQLPPITSASEGPAQFCFDAPLWARLSPLVCYLSEQHRQEDRTFLSTLSAIRRGEIDDAVYECFAERRSVLDELPEGVPHLFTHNTDVDERNSRELAQLSGERHTFTMTSKGKSSLVQQMMKSCLSPEVLELKEGASVMFTKNNFDAGYVNGTLGTVTSFDETTGFPVVVTRTNEEIVAYPQDWEIEDEGKVVARLTQVPLRLAWAITVHKSQGMSMDAASMDLSRAFEYGQGYVALSRVRTLSGLHLLGLNERALQVHPLVLLRDRAFREESRIVDDAFATMSEEELSLMHKNFLFASGGTIKEKEKADVIEREKVERSHRVHSRELTRALIEQHLSVTAMVQERGLSRGTIVGHIEELARTELPPDISYLKKELPKGLIPKVRSAFQKTIGTDEEGKLAPVKRLLPDGVSYEEIRLARLFLS